jgi:RNA polymerase sigma factor (TIGR02999 family)
MKRQPGEVTRLLDDLNRGRKEALDRLLPLVYKDLRRLAGRYLNEERVGHTLQPTALVHETYLRLVGQERADWQNRGQFFGVAAQMMRRILVDYARACITGKRAGNAVKLDLAGFELPASTIQMEEILAVDEALERLVQFDPRQGRVVELRYFAGLTIEETAEALGVSPRTVTREWVMASAWLRGQLSRAAHV